MALLDRTVELGLLPAAHDVDEVLHVAVRALEFLDYFAGATDRDRRRVAADNHAAALAVDHVADVAIAIEVNPVPVVVHRALGLRVAVRRHDGRRAGPEIVVDGGGHRRGTFGLPDAVAPLVTKAARRDDLAEVAGAHKGDRFLQ